MEQNELKTKEQAGTKAALKTRLSAGLEAFGQRPHEAIPGAKPEHVDALFELHRDSEAAKAPPLPPAMQAEQWAGLRAFLLDGDAHQDFTRSAIYALAALNEGRQEDFWAGLFETYKTGLANIPGLKVAPDDPPEKP